MKFDEDTFIIEGVSDEFVELELEALDELAEDVIDEEIKHMTSKEKLDAEKYRKSARGKKAIKKYLKKTEKAGYRPDLERSKTAKRVAALRNEDDENLSITEEEAVLLDSMIDTILHEFRESLGEACKKEGIDPETMDETSIHHMTSQEKAMARAYRRSARGKRAVSRYLKKRSRSGYRVNRERSKMASRVAALRRDFEEYDDTALTEEEERAYDELVADIINAIESGELDEADMDDEPCPECGNNPCTCDTDDDDDMDEASIHHMTSQEKAKARAYRRSAQGKRAILKHLRKTERSGYRVNKELSKKMKKVAALRNESLMESFDDFMLVNGRFGSLNEEESQSLLKGLKESLQEFLTNQEETNVRFLKEEVEGIVNEDVVPVVIGEMNMYLEEKVIPSFLEAINAYMTYVAESVSDELLEKKLVVKSSKTAQLEEFTEELFDLIKDKLKILPEQEDALDSYKDTIKGLQEKVSEERIEKLKLREEAIEAKKQLFINENLPKSLSEATREALSEEIMDIDVSTFEGFKKKAQKIIEEHLPHEEKRVLKEDVSHETDKTFSFTEALKKARYI